MVNLAGDNGMSNKLELEYLTISIANLKKLSDSGDVISVDAIECGSGLGYVLLANTPFGYKVLHKTRKTSEPRVFRSLDSIVENCRLLELEKLFVHVCQKPDFDINRALEEFLTNC